MNRWTTMAFAALVVALGGAWLKLRVSEPVAADAEPAPSAPVRVAALGAARPPTTTTDASPSSTPAPTAAVEASPRGRASTDAGAYDDAYLYRGDAAPERLPPTAQGVLEAFARSKEQTASCLSSARGTNAALTSLQTVEVRLAAQDDGSAAIEEVRLPTSNDPALAFRGCLVAALAAQRFEVPAEGFVRLTLPVELAR